MAAPDRANPIVLAVGRALRLRRRTLRLTQEEVAFRTGLSRNYVTAIELGKRNVALLNLVKLSRALGAQPSDVLKVLDAPQPGEPKAD